MCMCSMLSLLTPRQSDAVGGPIGSMREAKKVESYPNYDAAYLAKRLGAGNPKALEHNRYKSANQFDSSQKEMVYLQNATKGYEAEAEECLKKEFKDWLAGVHEDNYLPKRYDNKKGGAIRRDMRGKTLDDWVPTWWGPNQLTYLPGVREYLREEAMKADQNSLDMNKLAHLGPQNVEEAWAYFKHWVKGRPVGPEECLHPSPATASDHTRPFRAGPTHMQHDTQYNADNPYRIDGDQTFNRSMLSPLLSAARERAAETEAAARAAAAAAAAAAAEAADRAVAVANAEARTRAEAADRAAAVANAEARTRAAAAAEAAAMVVELAAADRRAESEFARDSRAAQIARSEAEAREAASRVADSSMTMAEFLNVRGAPSFQNSRREVAASTVAAVDRYVDFVEPRPSPLGTFLANRREALVARDALVPPPFTLPPEGRAQRYPNRTPPRYN